MEPCPAALHMGYDASRHGTATAIEVGALECRVRDPGGVPYAPTELIVPLSEHLYRASHRLIAVWESRKAPHEAHF